jgi:tRNA-binding EMAP/Myf-like protein
MSIPFSDFQKVELRAGTVMAAERVEGSDKLIRMEVDFGHVAPMESPATEPASDAPAAETPAPTEPQRFLRQIVAGIGKAYEPEHIVGHQFIFVANLEPRKLMGLESQGMILAASLSDGSPVLLHPDKEVPPGALIH